MKKFDIGIQDYIIIYLCDVTRRVYVIRSPTKCEISFRNPIIIDKIGRNHTKYVQ